jgi:3-methyladenine DNA glycosylase AlkD
MTFEEAMSQLESLGSPEVRRRTINSGSGDNLFGVKMGDIRALAKKIGPDPELAERLWASRNLDAMLLATLLMKPKQLTEQDLDRLVGTIGSSQVADWLGTNVVKAHPAKESRREKWMAADHDFTARMGWSLTAERIVKNPDGLDLSGLLDRIESEMPAAPTVVQWTMNYCLAEIGINFPDQRARAIAIGEKIGAFRDYPTPKGCTSPYAPIWIEAMVARQA